jgi:hypothetical protein
MKKMRDVEEERREQERPVALHFMIVILLFVLLVSGIPALRAAEPQVGTGTVEFTAMATPAGGRAEPVMRLSISLLRRSYAEIQKEAEQSEAKPDQDKFIDALSVSKELKAWMKRTHSVELSGSDFAKRVTTKDLFDVPEFLESYMARNAGDASTGFPVSKARERDRSENPERFEKAKRDYLEALRKFVETNPHSRDGMEIELVDINPGPKWAAQDGDRKQRIRDRTLELAETSYLLAKTETDLSGRGAFANVLPGDYWLSSLEGEATVGNARLRWDIPVPVRAGRVTRLMLTNVNAVRKTRE